MPGYDTVHTEAIPIPTWPQRFRPFSFAAGSAFTCSFLFLAYHVPESLSDDDIGIRWLTITNTILFALISLWLFEYSGFSSMGLSRRITTHTDTEYGRGIEIPTGSTTLLSACAIAALVTPTGAVMIYAVVTHADAVLIPRDEVAEHVPFIALTAVSTLVIALLPLRIRGTTVLQVYEDGIRRRVTIRRLRLHKYDTFVKWDDIEDVAADVFLVHTKGPTICNPMIRLRVPGPVPTVKLVPFDEENEVAISEVFSVAASLERRQNNCRSDNRTDLARAQSDST